LLLLLPLASDQAGLRRFALAVSTPGSPQYGQYESIAALSQRFGASAAVRRTVVSRLRAAGAGGVAVDATGMFVRASMTARGAARLFGVSLARYQPSHGRRFIAPTGSVVVPRSLRGLVTGVIGLDTRPLFRAAATARSASGLAGTGPGWSHPAALAQAPAQPSSIIPHSGTATACPEAVASGGFTPNQYLSAYGFDPLRSAGVTGQGERVALIEIDGFKRSDISRFARCIGVRAPPIHAFGVGVRGALPPGGETTLDLEVLTAAAPGLRAIDVYQSAPLAVDALYAMIAPLQHQGYKPQVISASLVLCEPRVAAALGKAGLLAVEGALEEAAASGISIVAASGDSGSAGCVSASTGAPIARLAVQYPASSWWVTGVGGTQLQLAPGTNQILGEIVWNDTTMQPGSAGGGGFSALWRRPRYQTPVVARNARAVPDVSMLADLAPGYAIYCTAAGDCINPANRKPWLAFGGTSAGTPLIAGGFALIDEQLRLSQHQDLGLANPLLYAAGNDPSTHVFNDVTAYGNDVGAYLPAGTPLGCCTAGVGFDEASGWGSVNIAAFSALALASQPAIVNVALAVPRGQRPIAQRRIRTRVTCSGRCLAGAYARVQIGHGRPFVVYSGVTLLRAAGTRAVGIKFSRPQLQTLADALVARRRITATVFGAITDPAGNIERKTVGIVVPIRG
jgi:kumamolisin